MYRSNLQSKLPEKQTYFTNNVQMQC